MPDREPHSNEPDDLLEVFACLVREWEIADPSPVCEDQNGNEHCKQAEDSVIGRKIGMLLLKI